MNPIKGRIDWRFCVIADAEAAGGRDLIWIAEQAVAGGATIIQLRGKTLSGKDLFEEGRRIRSFLKKEKIPLIINDRCDIALACKAEGVHLGQEDLPLSAARKILGPERIIGISVRNAREAAAAESDGADYLGIGPVFPTSSKIGSGPSIGLEGMKAVRRMTKLPLLAIGGITIANAAEVIRAGADGIAVISSILAAENIRQACRDLKRLVCGSRAEG